MNVTGGSAEWILERQPNGYQDPPHLPGFSSAPQIWNASTYFDSSTSLEYYTNYADDNPTMITMTSNGQSNGQVIADAITAYYQPDRMQFRCYRHY